MGTLWMLVSVCFIYLAYLGFLESKKYQTMPEYFSGVAVFEDHLKCGLVKTRQMDRYGCAFVGEICSDLREYQNLRIRIRGVRMECGPGSDFKCSKQGEFNEGTFVPELCYRDYSLVKVFNEGSPNNP